MRVLKSIRSALFIRLDQISFNGAIFCRRDWGTDRFEWRVGVDFFLADDS